LQSFRICWMLYQLFDDWQGSKLLVIGTSSITVEDLKLMKLLNAFNVHLNVPTLSPTDMRQVVLFLLAIRCSKLLLEHQFCSHWLLICLLILFAVPQECLALFKSYYLKKVHELKACGLLFFLVNVKVRLRRSHVLIYYDPSEKRNVFQCLVLLQCSLLITSFNQTVVSSIAQGIATWFQCSRYMRW